MGKECELNGNGTFCRKKLFFLASILAGTRKNQILYMQLLLQGSRKYDATFYSGG